MVCYGLGIFNLKKKGGDPLKLAVRVFGNALSSWGNFSLSAHTFAVPAQLLFSF